MGRIRTIKPEFPQSESMGRVSRDARLLFVLLWTIVDDSGRTRAASRMLASLLFPYDDDAPKLIDGWLAELERVQCIVRYSVNGDTYLEVCKWAEHQRIDRPTPSKFPAFDESSRVLVESSSLDQGPRTKDQGSKRATARHPAPVQKPPEVADQTWSDWLAHRKAKRAPVTATALDGIRREAAAAGMDLEAALKHSLAQGWQGFRAEWVKSGHPASKGTGAVVQTERHRSDLDLGDPACGCLSCRAVRRDRGQQVGRVAQ